MTQQEILEGNKLIVEFMGFIYNDSFAHLDKNSQTNIYSYYEHTEGHGFLLRDCKYHSSWDWLMPVVENIEEKRLGYFQYNQGWSFFGYDGNCKWYTNNNKKGILNLYFEVIEFIKWINKQK